MADLFVAEARAAGGVRKRVAIKRVQPRHAHDQSFLSMFLNEARLASTLQHPNIVQTYDVLHVRDEYFIVMELLEGCDLQEFLRLQRRVPSAFGLDHVLYIASRALAALHYAHERTDHRGEPLGITHRDVSAHNLFLTYQGGVKLLDFGIALAEETEHDSASEMLKGKVLYMAPEQCQASTIDRRTDVYAMGVLLYKMLTGAYPYRGVNTYDTMRAILHQQPAPPRSIRPDLPVELERILLRALEKDPDARFPTARHMQEELEAVARANQWFVSDLDFSLVLSEVAPPTRPRPPVEGPLSLPEDLVVGATEEAQPTTHTPSQRPERVDVLSTEVASVRRLRGVTVLALRGAIDERLDVEAVAPLLTGDLLVDTQHVQRVTSYGIRQLLRLVSAHQGGRMYHINMSPAFIEQAAMVRSLLGSGHVASYLLPFVDPVTGRVFTQRYSGADGDAILATQQPPRLSCPDASDRLAVLDDAPESLLFFGQSYVAEPPEHIASAIRACDIGGATRDIEKQVVDRTTELVVHCPITNGIRWSRVLRGVEGVLVVDLTHVPFSTQDGLQALAAALIEVSNDIEALRWRGLEVHLHDWIRGLPLGGKSELQSARVATRCTHCDAPRQLVLRRADLTGPLGTNCHQCGGALVVESDIPMLSEVGEPPVITGTAPLLTAPVAPSHGTPPAVWAFLFLAVVAVFVAGTMLAASLVLTS